MGAYLLRRLWQAVLVLLAVTVLVFMLVLLTGDPVRAILPIDASDADVARIRHLFGLDRPGWVQYLLFLQQALHGNLGESFKFHQPALPLVLERLPNTAVLALASLVFSTVVAIPLGVLSATHRGRAWDYLSTGISTLSVSTPGFWLGIILILFFAGQLNWLPASGTGGFSHVILPTIALSSYSIGLITRLVRATMADVLDHAYLVTARSKGLSELMVTYRHAFRNALIPVVTVLGLQLGGLLGGSVVIETVFAWPGVGWLLIQGIGARDLPLIRSDILIVAVLFVLINLATDILYSAIDPRIRYA